MSVASVAARIEQVTVFANGARVRRVATVPAPLPERVRIVGLPLAVIDDTVRVEVGGPATATLVRIGLESPPAFDAAAEDSAELMAAKTRAAHAEAQVVRLTAALEVIAQGPVVSATDDVEQPLPSWDAIVAARLATVTVRAERELAVRSELATARRELDEAKRALDAALDRERRAGTARPAKIHELRKHLELDLAVVAAGELVIHIDYQVAAARWAPSYVVRLDGDHAALEVRAAIAQDTGEDWSAVALRLSTAEPDRFSVLPELAAQRIGRRQSQLPRRGFRPAPSDTDALYADYDRAQRARRHPAASPDTATFVAQAVELEHALADEVWDEDSSRAKQAFHTPPLGTPLNAIIAATAGGTAGASERTRIAPMPVSPVRRAEPVLRQRPAPSPPPMPGAAMVQPAPQAPAPAMAMQASTVMVGWPAAPVPRLDYGNLRMARPTSKARGTLVPAAPDRHATAVAHEVAAAVTRVTSLALPAGCVVEWSHLYDYAFETEGAVDVRADGGWHSIAVTARPSTAKLRHITVPREQPDAFRVAVIVNPFAAPLLPGPIDVYDRGRFLVTSRIDFTPPHAVLELGLGVDASVKIARNSEFHEEAAGVLRGSLRLVHAIAIDIENLSGRAIDLEVRERVPVTRDGDDHVEVVIGRVEPAWERWTPDADSPHAHRLRGGHRWRLALAAGAKRTLRAGYEVKIANKHELVGGNRRES